MSVLLVACQSQDDKIRIATKPMTEQFIIAEMLAILIEQETGTTVEITKGIGGGTANIHPAMLKGEFDLYPEYTGTAWLYVLKNEPIFDQAVLLENLKKAIKINITFAGWVCMALIIPSAWRCVLTMPMPIKLPLLVSLHPLAQILLLVLSMIF